MVGEGTKNISAVSISDRKVGPGEPVFIIAEAGVNHNGSLDLAMKLMDAAALAGADAMKFQTFKADRLLTKLAPKAGYQRETTGGGTQMEMLRSLELGDEDFLKLKAHADELGMMFLSTPFDADSAYFLAGLGVPAFKVSSGDLTNHPLLRHVAGLGEPVILSTGMATLQEIKEALDVLRSHGGPPIILLHCTSAYPAPFDSLNLRAIQTLVREFSVPVGFSDHSTGIHAPVAAAALGACVIEKHFTLDKGMEGPDHRASLSPQELTEMVGAIRDIETALGDGTKAPAQVEEDVMRAARKSVVAAHPIKAGEVVTEAHLDVKRPGTGISPARMAEVVGKRALRDIAEGELLDWEAVG